MATTLRAFGKFVAEGLVLGALGKAGGWVLSSIVGGPDEEQMRAIRAVGQKVSAVEGSVKALSEQLANDTRRILAELEQIKQQQRYMAWQSIDKDLQGSISKVEVQFTRFLEYARNPQETSPKAADQLATEILDSNFGAAVAMADVSKLLTGVGQNKGALELFTEMVEPLIRDDRITAQAAMANYLNYYVAAAYTQQRCLYLLVEAYHKDNNNKVAKAQRETYQGYVRAQEIPFLRNIERILRQGLVGGVSASGTFTLGYVRAVQDYLCQAAFAGAYEPTRCRERAEEIITDSLCLDDSDTRIVVWMLYSQTAALYVRKDYEHVDVEIVPAGERNGPGISPSYAKTIELPALPEGSKSPDYYEMEHNIKRMVYQNVPAGSYVMKDKNGKDGLETFQGSQQDAHYFQDPEYLAHQLTVNDAVQGASMDFCVYAFSSRIVRHRKTWA